jgi:release factor glutamine methyltransferase
MNLTDYPSPKKSRSNTAIRISDWLIKAKEKLQLSPLEPVSSIWVLLSHVLNETKTWLIANSDTHLSSSQILQLDNLLDQLISGVPLAYLIGHWSFFGLDFIVNLSVLIPRPETEILVEKALAWLSINTSRRSMAEVGIGSGCISISLSKQIPDLQICATDVSLAALRVAQQNIINYSLNKFFLVQSNLLDCIQRKFDLICANLPYIPSSTLKSLPVSKYEPIQALDGGADGLFFIKKFISAAPNYLTDKSLLLMEIENSQKEAVLEIAYFIFPDSTIQIFEDLAHLPRLLMVQTC